MHEYIKFVIAAYEPQSREVRIIHGIAGRARNDVMFVSGLSLERWFYYAKTKNRCNLRRLFTGI